MRRGVAFAFALLVMFAAARKVDSAPEPRAKRDTASSLEEAWNAWNDGDRARAGEIARRLAGKEQESGPSVRLALLLARTASDADEALQLWDNVLELEPEKSVAAEAHWGRGVAAHSLGQWPTAIEEFGRVAREHRRASDRGKAYLAKGLVELDAGETRDALESLALAERHAKLASDRTSAELALASANYRLGNLGVALRGFERFERDHAKDERARWATWRAVLCLRLLGRESDAAEKTLRLEQEEPGSLESILAREEVRMGGKAASPRASKTDVNQPGGERKDAKAKDDASSRGDR